MHLKNKLLFVLLALLISFNLYASEPRIFYAPSASLYGGYYGTMGLTQAKREALGLPVRTSATVNLDTSMVGFQIGQVELTAGPSAAFITDSLKYGRVNLVNFYTLGLELSFLYHFDDQLSLGGSYTLSFLNYLGTPFTFQSACQNAQITLDYAFKLYPRFAWSVIVPLTVSYRGEYLGLQGGIGVRLAYYRIMKAPKWLLEQQKYNQKQN